MMLLCNIAIFANNITIFAISVLKVWSGVWFMATARLASELESDLRDTVDWGKKWLVDLNAGKTHFVLIDLA